MKVLITGATGLIGSKLTALCLEAGMTVHYLTTSKAKIKTSTNNCKGFYWNPAQGEIDETALKDVTAIVHLAGASIARKWTTSYRKEIIDSRVKSATLLLKTVAKWKDDPVSLNDQPLMHFISASAIGGYPSSLTKEYSETYPEYAKGFLGEVIEAWEGAAFAFRKLEIAVSVLRTGIVIDPEFGAFPKMANPIKKGIGAALGSGDQWQSWIHSIDAARLYFYVLQHKLEGIYNVVAPSPITNKQLTTLIGKYLKRPILLPAVPTFTLKLLLGKMASIVLESQKVSSQKIMDTGFEFHYTIAEHAIEDCCQHYLSPKN